MIKKKTIIIAEAGVNHNGNFEIAKKMIKSAAAAGADFIKFQLFLPESLSTSNAKLPFYARSKKKFSQLHLLKKLAISQEQCLKLKKICTFTKINFLASAFDIESLNFLKKMNQKIFKIPSGEINNIPYLRHLAKFKKKIILSTGMANIYEVKNALKILISNGTKKNNICLLQCNTNYPTSFNDLNLNVLKTLKKKFEIDIGLSDHTLGIEASIAAVAMGARIIEKHFTLNKKFRGPDHKASLDTQELKNLIKSIRNIEVGLGSHKKQITNSEKKNIKYVRKSIVAKKKILKGEYFTEQNITTKRPAIGKSPIHWDKILGKISKKNYNKDQLI